MNYSDPSGNLQARFFPIYADESSAVPHFVGSSDGERDSDDLLQYIVNAYSTESLPFNSSVVYTSVEYSGVYNKDGRILDWVLMGSGRVVSKIPHPYAVIAGKAIGVLGFLDLVYSYVESLPDGEYFQYTVTMTWTDTVSPVGFPNIFITQNHQLVVTYVWNDSKIESPYWHMINYDHSATSSTWSP